MFCYIYRLGVRGAILPRFKLDIFSKRKANLITLGDHLFTHFDQPCKGISTAVTEQSK